MQPGFGAPETQPPPESSSPVVVWMNQTHIVHQIHSLQPTTHHHLFQNHHHFLPPNFVAGGSGTGAAVDSFPAVNFRLGLNEFYSRNEVKGSGVGESFSRRNQEYEVPETRHSFGPFSSGIKLHQPFWEPLPSEVSNENSEIVDRQENHHNKESLPNCKERVQFGELEAIYKSLPTSSTTPNPKPEHIEPPSGFDPGSEDLEEGSLPLENMRKKRRKKRSKYNEMIPPMAECFGKLVKQMMNHQEDLNQKFTELIERLDEERRVREEEWRIQEITRFEKEAKRRAHERRLADNREAMVVSYLEKLTGHKLNFSLHKD